jgi:hypothetical protein
VALASVGRGLGAEVGVTLKATPGGQVLADARHRGQHGEDASRLERIERGTDEREEAAAERQIAPVDGGRGEAVAHQPSCSSSAARRLA